MPKKVASKKSLALDGGSSFVQAQAAVAAVANTLVKHYEAFDLRPPSNKFEQTFELRATTSIAKSINEVCAGRITKKVGLRVMESEIIPMPRADKVVVFEAFFEDGIGSRSKACRAKWWRCTTWSFLSCF
ncbi:hypothetical protein GUJ93_ZPchr0002g24244 [Zizania palustris]|uniref:Uncharacterized protein n=1 Tax=Zizania palustris TaxID=103762 RepID=A0A8J5SS76_ZIZPA|nr:hypothetical protein GUJ93_ZPchr0002g24244 [Zizania palustris]